MPGILLGSGKACCNEIGGGGNFSMEFGVDGVLPVGKLKPFLTVSSITAK
jgi:hypothetical protein